MRILLIEDELEIAQYLIRGLRESSYEVVHARDALQGTTYALFEDWDVAIIDRMLPENQDGIQVIQAIRQTKKTQPIIVLSALSSIDERLRGLNEGGNDYVVKPFDMNELLARVEVQIKQNTQNNSNKIASNFDSIVIDNLVINLQTHKVQRGEHIISLQPKEFHLLKYLALHQSQIVTRTMLLEAVWGINMYPDTNVIEAMISRLRSKIDRNFDLPLLHTIRGKGYRLGV